MIVAGDTIEAGGFANDRAEEITFRALSKRDPVRIALLLPLTAKGETNVNYLEFYQGFLLGLRHVKNEYGYSADLTLFNTDRDPQKVAEIVASDPFRDADLIVGPIYEEELPEVLAHAGRRSVPSSRRWRILLRPTATPCSSWPPRRPVNTRKPQTCSADRRRSP